MFAAFLWFALIEEFYFRIDKSFDGSQTSKMGYKDSYRDITDSDIDKDSRRKKKEEKPNKEKAPILKYIKSQVSIL